MDLGIEHWSGMTVRAQGWRSVISRRYGSRRGLCRHIVFLAFGKVGGLRAYRQLDWNRVKRVVFVCYGNICRSPYAEARARSLGAIATSFGLDGVGSSPADPKALRNARRRGIDLSGHRSRSIEALAPGDADLLVAMEPWHGKRLLSMVGGVGAQVTLLGFWSSRPRPYIQDPHGLADDYFENCFAFIDGATERLIGKIAGARQRNDSPMSVRRDSIQTVDPLVRR